MDTMEKYKIQQSIKDVIDILDSAPIRPDMIAEVNLVQLTNRIPIAHLAIERGLKALITEAGGTAQHTHALNRLYRNLRACDKASAEYLAGAFDDAAAFFGLNVNDKGMGYLRSIEDYLNKVGTDDTFETLRYWAIGESGRGQKPWQYIPPSVHRELLCALWCIFFPTRRDVVSERVERKVENVLFHPRMTVRGADDTAKERSIKWYMDWLFNEHETRRCALEDAVQHNLNIKEDDEFISQWLREACSELSESDDPAVQYFIRTLTYLPKGSQRSSPDAIPEVKWLNDRQTRAAIETPAGTPLGFVEKYADGGWGIMPMEEGLVQIVDIARSVRDAKHYLVNRLTRRVSVTVDETTKPMRIVSNRDFILHKLTSGKDVPDSFTYDLAFWDDRHGLSLGDRVLVQLQVERDGGFTYVLEGKIMEVEKQKVSVTGISFLS